LLFVYVLITRFMFYDWFLFVFVCFAFLFCVFSVFVLFSPHLHSCFVSICVQTIVPLSPDWNPIAFNEYRSYHIIYCMSSACYMLEIIILQKIQTRKLLVMTCSAFFCYLLFLVVQTHCLNTLFFECSQCIVFLCGVVQNLTPPPPKVQQEALLSFEQPMFAYASTH
jgi:hypothetical protein